MDKMSSENIVTAWKLVEFFLAQETTLEFVIVCKSVDDFVIVLRKYDETKAYNYTYITARGNTLLYAVRELALVMKNV